MAALKSHHFVSFLAILFISTFLLLHSSPAKMRTASDSATSATMKLLPRNRKTLFHPPPLPSQFGASKHEVPSGPNPTNNRRR
uniref:Clavata3/embryo surrounding region-related 41 n=1 Tax=Cuscuta japonica TaxID=81913 RepID=A0A2Z5U3G0_CUSJA|nr:clavata3/embryo surrounding region-related 41 [Cuscuta japonica]